MDIRAEIQTRVDEIEQIIKRYLPEEEGWQKTIMEAMNYSILAGGKRLRPMLMSETYRLFGGKSKVIEPFMAAMEMIHTYSLVHDDLPAMDNDEYRRGKKTTHAVYGEAMGILAGDALLNYAFETAAKAFDMEPDNRNIGKAMQILATKAGTHFHCEKVGMEQIKSDEPCLVLMNHSCFLDLKIAEAVLYPRPFNIVCTSDGFVGKEWLMRSVGCIPTRKFCSDTTLVRDMLYCVRTLKTSVLLYPEASYSFDGTATPLPESIGKCVKALNVPVVMIRTYGAFARDPLYNGLQKRRAKVSAQMQCLLSSDDVAELNVAGINERIFSAFRFDNFRWQEENGVSVSEPFRADGLNRVLYKCPHCFAEGKMEGKGISVNSTT